MLDLIYSDEDKISANGQRYEPHFKSDWNPDLFCEQSYICHLVVLRTALVRDVGGFRTGVEGAQDWDLLWRVMERSNPERVCHVPFILYHWRSIEGSTAQGTGAKPYVLEAQRPILNRRNNMKRVA